MSHIQPFITDFACMIAETNDEPGISDDLKWYLESVHPTALYIIELTYVQAIDLYFSIMSP